MQWNSGGLALGINLGTFTLQAALPPWKQSQALIEEETVWGKKNSVVPFGNRIAIAPVAQQIIYSLA